MIKAKTLQCAVCVCVCVCAMKCELVIQNVRVFILLRINKSILIL